MATIFNFVGFFVGLPLVFSVTATIFFAAAPGLMQTAQVLHNAPSTNDVRAALAGIIILLIGSGISFAGVPTEGIYLSSIVDVIVVVFAAVCDIIGAGILGNIGAVTLAAQVLIILVLFAVAVFFGSKSLMYATMILSTLLWVNLLPNSFGNSGKFSAAYIISWIGMTVSMFWSFVVIAVNRAEKDAFEDAEAGKSTQK